MLLFSSWDRPSFRAEGNPPAAPISTIASMFKALKFRRRDRERSDPQTSVNPKKSIPNTPHRPEIRVLSLVSHVPIGPARNPPPLPPKALEPSSRFQRDFSPVNEVAEPSNSLAHLGDDGIPGFKFNDREREHQRNPPPGQQTRPGLSRQILSSTRPFQNIEPQIIAVHTPGEAIIDHHGTIHQNARKISRTDVALPLVKGAAPAKTIPPAIHGFAVDAEMDTSVQGSAVLSQSASPLSAHSSSLSSPNPMTLEVGNSPNPPQPFPTHSPIGPSSIPVVGSSTHEGGISTSGNAEQEGNEPLPQDGNTPRLESGPSVGSFIALKSRWSSTTNYTTEEEESPSFLKSFKFRRGNKANGGRQTFEKAKESTTNQTNTARAWLPSFSRGTASSSRIPPPSPPKGFRSSQCGSPSTNNLAERLQHPLNPEGRRTPNPKTHDRHGPSQRDPPPGHQLPAQSDGKVDISRKKVSFIQPGGNAGPQAPFDRRHRAPALEALDVQGAMRQNARKSSRTNLALPPVQGAIRAKSTPLGAPSLSVDVKKDTSTKGSATLFRSDCLPIPRPPSSPKATSFKTDDWSIDPKWMSSHRPIRPNWKPTIAVWWASELPPQDDSDDTPRLATGPSLKSFVSLRSRRSSSTSGDSEEEAFGRDRPVATNQDDKEQVSSTFTASACRS